MEDGTAVVILAHRLHACCVRRSELLAGTQDSSSLGGSGGMGGPTSPTDAASPDTSVPGDECTGELKPYGCPCTDGAECEDGFCATDYAPRAGSSECEGDKIGGAGNFLNTTAHAWSPVTGMKATATIDTTVPPGSRAEGVGVEGLGGLTPGRRPL